MAYNLARVAKEGPGVARAILRQIALRDSMELLHLRADLAQACLLAYVQANFTGPALGPDGPQTDAELDAQASRELTRNGEAVYAHSVHPWLLLVAVHGCRDMDRLCATIVHVRLLDSPANEFCEYAGWAVEKRGKNFQTPFELLMAATLMTLLHREKQARAFLDRAAAAAGMSYGLTGALGRRTQHQSFDVAQLVVRLDSERLKSGGENATPNQAGLDAAASDLPANCASAETPKPPCASCPPSDLGHSKDCTGSVQSDESQECSASVAIAGAGTTGDQKVEQTESHNTTPAGAVRSVPLQDDVVRDGGPELQDSGTELVKLSDEQNAVLLGECAFLLAFHARDAAVLEAAWAYVQRVLDGALSAGDEVIRRAALLVRSALECGRPRTAERAALQLQALADAARAPDGPAVAPLFVFAVPLWPVWQVDRQQARLFAGLGALRTAAEIFGRVSMDEERLSCLVQLGERALAEEELAGAIASAGSNSALHARLLCVRGDLRGDAEDYRAAWDVSGRTCARAMRALGSFHIRRDEGRSAAACLRLAVALNPAHPRVLFLLGCVEAGLGNDAGAASAFMRAVANDPDDGDAWNNIAALHVRAERHEEALVALRHAARCQRESWRVWENVLRVALACGEASEAVGALRRVVEIRGRDAGLDTLDMLLAFLGRRPETPPGAIPLADCAELSQSGSCVASAAESGNCVASVAESGNCVESSTESGNSVESSATLRGARTVVKQLADVLETTMAPVFSTDAHFWLRCADFCVLAHRSPAEHTEMLFKAYRALLDDSRLANDLGHVELVAGVIARIARTVRGTPEEGLRVEQLAGMARSVLAATSSFGDVPPRVQLTSMLSSNFH